MKVLWLSHNVPYPPQMGVTQRNYHLIRQLAQNAEVHLVALRQHALCPDEAALERARQELSSFCASVDVFELDWEMSTLARARLAFSLFAGVPYDVIRYASHDLRTFLATNPFESLDLVHLDTIGLAPYRDLLPQTPTVLNHHNIESHMLFRRAENTTQPVARLFFNWQASRTRAWERRLAAEVECNLVVSETDTERLREVVPGARVAVIANGVDVGYFDGPPNDDPEAASVVMVGSHGWYPNRDAALWFLDEIWPRIIAVKPNARWIVIGSEPDPRIIEAGQRDARIEVLGFVDDLRPDVDRSAVFVCPYHDGGGSRLKVLDSLAMRKALVSTPVGVEGIPLEDGTEFLLASSAEDFADCVLELFDDPARRVALGEAGRAHVERVFAWERIGETLTSHYSKLSSALRSESSGEGGRVGSV
jgi:glycosyltransferase involved in cell wall biosynthesis